MYEKNKTISVKIVELIETKTRLISIKRNRMLLTLDPLVRQEIVSVVEKPRFEINDFLKR